MTIRDWVFSDDAPTESGWYAVSKCWDPQEGIVPGAGYWNGVKWSTDAPVVARSPIIFETEELAQSWARAHDIEDPK